MTHGDILILRRGARNRKRYRWLRLAGWAWLTLTALAFFAAFRMTRDPRPYFAARHGQLVEVELQSRILSSISHTERLRLTSNSGLSLEMAVRWPQGSKKNLPLVMILGGHRTGRDALDLLPETNRAIIATLSYPYDGDHRLKGLAALAALPKIRRALRDTPAAFSLALDHLLQQPGVDTARVEAVGVSLGAPLVSVAAALDPRFTRVWSVHGGARLRLMLDHNLRQEIPSALLRTPLSALGGLLLYQLEPEHFVEQISPRPFLMINVEDDEKIPRECVDALYRAAREPKELLWLTGGHIRPGREEMIQTLFEGIMMRIADDAAEGEELLPSQPSPK